MLTVGSMFSGIGGMDLGLERAGMRVIWQCENDDFASMVLKKHWSHVPNFGDVTKIDWPTVERPDVLAGGFMCTDLSSAGRMAGLDGDTRSGITWRELVRAVVSLRPRYVLVENVPMLLSGDGGRWFGTVLGQLAALGYDAEWDCLPASAVGAPHFRNRVFIVAYPHTSDGETRLRPVNDRPASAERRHNETSARNNRAAWMEITSGVLRGSHGVPRRMDRTSGLGNAVVPQVAELIGGWIVRHAEHSCIAAHSDAS